MGRSSRSAEAAELACRLLAPLPERWAHTVGVAGRARLVAERLYPHLLDAETADTLVAAAWLHDVGYSPDLVASGFHPLDGARLLDGLPWAHDLSPLVAHHSGARFTARAQGLAAALSEYPFSENLLTDALTFADQTVGPRGVPTTIERRIAETLRRHGPHSVQAAVRPSREPYLLAVADRMQARLGGRSNCLRLQEQAQ